MGERRKDCVTLLICLIYMLNQETKRNITRIVNENILDGALHAMFKRGLLPDWFEKHFAGYISLYGMLPSLTDLFIGALEFHLVRFYYFGAYANMNIMLTDDSCDKYLRQMEIEPDRAREWARILEEEILKRMEKKH